MPPEHRNRTVETDMLIKLNILAYLTLAALPSLQAQVPVKLSGKVTDGSAAACYYCPGFKHVIKHSGTRLQSSTLDLDLFMNQQVQICGTWDGTFVTVVSAEVVPESFSISGGGKIGGFFSFNSYGIPGDLGINLLAFRTGMTVPFADLGLLLDLVSLRVLGSGSLGSTGDHKDVLDIPNEPGLIGLRIFGQGVILTQDGSFFSTNLDSKLIR